MFSHDIVDKTNRATHLGQASGSEGPEDCPVTGIVVRCATACLPGRSHRGSQGCSPQANKRLLRVPEWRNWQTRGTQNPVRLIPSVGSSPTSGTNTTTSYADSAEHR